jgi:hypothetical protein
MSCGLPETSAKTRQPKSQRMRDGGRVERTERQREREGPEAKNKKWEMRSVRVTSPNIAVVPVSWIVITWLASVTTGDV